MSTETYISDDEIRNCENSDLICLDAYRKYDLDSDYTAAGFDVGKKRHPSHLSIYIKSGNKIVQKYQIFLDGWPYTKQIKFLNMVMENFDIDKGYVDNTRGELEERGLHHKWAALTFTAKQKRRMAQIFEEYVHSGNLEIIPDERQRSQIICVDNELNAPETPMGHGDSFFSNALALMAMREGTEHNTRNVGDVQDLVDNRRSSLKTIYNGFGEKEIMQEEACPKCGQVGGWVKEHQKCLLCFADSMFDGTQSYFR